MLGSLFTHVTLSLGMSAVPPNIVILKPNLNKRNYYLTHRKAVHVNSITYILWAKHRIRDEEAYHIYTKQNEK